MAIKFSPNDFLDIASDPSELPSTSDGKNEISGAMRRCTNLHLDKAGIASTRKGSSKINASAVDELLSTLLIEQEGYRYLFTDTKIYQDETAIKTALTQAKWHAIKYNSFNSIIQNIFCMNGYERKRIVDNEVYEWGLAAPDMVPALSTGIETGLTGDYNAKYTYARKEGDAIVCESNPSGPAETAETLSNGSLRIICDGPGDDQITHIRIYRTDVGGVNYYHDQDMPLAPNADYAYTYDWEMQDAYFTGDGYKITTLETGTAGITLTEGNSVDDGTGVWSVVSGAGVILGIGIPEGLMGSKVYVFVKIPAGKTGIVKYRKHLESWNLSEKTYLKWSINNDTAGARTVNIYMGETSYTEQEAGDFSTPIHWSEKAWDISAITKSERDEITEIAFEHHNTGSVKRYFYFKDITSDSFAGSYEVIFPWEPNGTDSYYYAKSIYHWEPIIIDTNTSDLSLGTEVETDHNRPPLGTFIFGPSLNGISFILKDNLLYYSKEKQPEYWPVLYYLEVSTMQFPLKAGCLYDTQIYVASADEIYQIPGTGHLSFGPPLAQSAITGTVSHKCFLGVKGIGIFHLGRDGLYLLSSKDENITNSRFRPLFEGTTVGSIPGIDKTNIANCWLIYFKNKLYFGYPESGSTYPDNFMVTDLGTMKTVHYDYDGRAFPCVGIDYENDRLLACDTEGYIWNIEDPDSTDDEGTVITWQIETKEYNDQLRKYFPRLARYDVGLGDGATANGYILMNGVSKQTHSITVSRKTKKRLVTGCTGDRIAMRITGTGPIDIYASECE